MGTTKLNLRNVTLTFLACLLVALPAIAKVTTSANTVNFSPPGAPMGYFLTVNGPGDFHYTKRFEAGELMTWTPEGDANGMYKFELRSEAPARDRNKDAVIDTKPVVMSGSIQVENGQLANTNRRENIQKDIVHLDDVIIEFSLCVGTDCVNGENFGFDTIRLKENNLRIHFDDTSTSASFPKNDWRIVINDSGNGGASYFGVEDSTAGRIPFRVEAGAPVNTLYAEADGDVGIKTANPVVDLHIVEGNTPTLRLEQDGSDGFTPQTYDIAANESNFFIRDVTNGSKLFFRAKPSAPEDSIFIAADGDVGMGTDNPAQDLHIRDASASAFVRLESVSAAQTAGMQIITNETGGNFWNTFVNNAGQYAISLGGGGNATNAIVIDDATGDVTINEQSTGTLTANNGLTVVGTCTNCDAVFTPAYELKSIEDHAASMWSNSYLPGVGPTPEGKVAIDIFEKATGILQELEVAHIYIEQLHNNLKEMQARLAALEADQAAE